MRLFKDKTLFSFTSSEQRERATACSSLQAHFLLKPIKTKCLSNEK